MPLISNFPSPPLVTFNDLIFINSTIIIPKTQNKNEEAKMYEENYEMIVVWRKKKIVKKKFSSTSYYRPMISIRTIAIVDKMCDDTKTTVGNVGVEKLPVLRSSWRHRRFPIKAALPTQRKNKNVVTRRLVGWLVGWFNETSKQRATNYLWKLYRRTARREKNYKRRRVIINFLPPLWRSIMRYRVEYEKYSRQSSCPRFAR